MVDFLFIIFLNSVYFYFEKCVKIWRFVKRRGWGLCMFKFLINIILMWNWKLEIVLDIFFNMYKIFWFLKVVDRDKYGFLYIF